MGVPELPEYIKKRMEAMARQKEAAARKSRKGWREEDEHDTNNDADGSG